MKLTLTTFVASAALLAGASLAPAQSNISPSAKHAWSENGGWLNWRDAGSPAGSQGVRLHSTFLSGFIWGENIGWISLGDGSPANNRGYANTTAADHGVNIQPDGSLNGLAWGENVGWINFSAGARAVPMSPARIDAAAGRFRGHVWGENIGWISLDHPVHFVALSVHCRADFNGNGQVTVQDLFDFLTAYFSAAARADFNASGSITVQDLFDFLEAWFRGCQPV